MTPRSYQHAAILWLTKTERGILEAPAGSGKTMIAAHALATILETGKGVWLAHTRDQLDQARIALERQGLSSRVTVACYQGMKPEDPLLQNCKVLVADECHWCSAPTFSELVRASTGRRWGLSATPFNDTDRDGVLSDLFTENVHSISREVVIEEGGLIPGIVKWVDGPPEDPALQDAVAELIDRRFQHLRTYNHGRRPDWVLKQQATWYEAHKHGIEECDARNNLVVGAAMQAWETGTPTLVLVNNVSHGELLRAAMGWTDRTQLVTGKLSPKKRRDALNAFRDEQIDCVIATSLADEGLDLPRATMLINAAGGKSPTKAIQRTGRVMRPHEAKINGIVVDFTDTHLATLAAHAAERRKTYTQLGYEQTEPLPL